MKDFAFVNRLFVIQLGNELGPRWTIYDKKGHVHHVTFNMNTYGPRITDGWVDIRKFYQVQPPKLCYLRHTGNSVFEIHFYDQCSEATVHKFLSHVRTNAPLIRSKLIHFEFRLSKYNCKASFLVIFLSSFSIIEYNLYRKIHLFCLTLTHTKLFVSDIIFYLFYFQGLNSDLRQYFANTQFSHIVLYGPKARVECKLLIRPRSVKIGSGWKRFREVHGLEEKDLILFEVDAQQASNDVNVLLNINDYYHPL